MISLYTGLFLTKLYAAHGFGFKTGSGFIDDRTLCSACILVPTQDTGLFLTALCAMHRVWSLRWIRGYW